MEWLGTAAIVPLRWLGGKVIMAKLVGSGVAARQEARDCWANFERKYGRR